MRDGTHLDASQPVAQGLTRTLDEATLLSELSTTPFSTQITSKSPTSNTTSTILSSGKKKETPTQLSLRSKSMRLKLSGNVREVSERRQVGDAEEMMDETRSAWWRNVGMEEGM